jgi:AraC family transcriptional activator of mtrCDE
MQNSNLGLNQLQAAKYEYLSEHVCDWRSNPRPFSTIAVMQKGEGYFEADNKSFEVKSGEVFFIPVGSKYISYWHGADEIMYYAIHFHFENSYSEFSPQRFCLQKIDKMDSDKFLRQFESVRLNLSAGGSFLLKAYGAFYSLYADILPMLDCAKPQNQALQKIKKAVDYIEMNSEKEFPVDYLASLCHLSQSRFYALFQRALGCSPIAYRNNVRIRNAITMLGSQYTVDDIAARVGFSSAVYFRRIFKEIMGKLPSEYRKNLQF